MKKLVLSAALFFFSAQLFAQEPANPRPVKPVILEKELLSQDDIFQLYRLINLKLRLSYDREQKCSEVYLERVCERNNEAVLRMLKDYRAVGWTIEKIFDPPTGEVLYIFSTKKE